MEPGPDMIMTVFSGEVFMTRIGFWSDRKQLCRSTMIIRMGLVV